MYSHESSLLKLTDYQSDMYIGQEISGNSTQYNIGTILTFRQIMNENKLKICLNKLTKYFDFFSIFLKKKDGEVYQYFSKLDKLNYKSEDWGNLTKQEQKVRITSYYLEELNLFEHPLYEFKYVKISENYHILLVKYYHIIVCGTAVYQLMDLLFDIYFGNDVNIKDNTRTCLNLLQTNRQYHASNTYQKDIIFWRNYLAKDLEPFFSETDLEKSKMKFHSMRIKGETYIGLINYALKKEVKLYRVIMAALINYFSRLLDKNEMRLGISVDTRAMEMKDILGYYVNILPINMIIPKDIDLAGILKIIKTNLAEVLPHKALAMSSILQGRKIDFIFNYVAYPLKEAAMKEKGWHVDTFVNQPKGQNIAVHLIEFIGSSLYLEVQYRSNLFGEEWVTDKIITYLSSIVWQLVQRDDFKEVSISSKVDKALIQKWNQTEVQKDWDKSVFHRFVETAEKYPNQLAIIDSNQSISYAKLLQKVNQISAGLHHNGISKGNVVGLYLQKGIGFISCVLGIWQVGAGYVPLDRTLPQKRLAFLVKDCNIRHIVVAEKGFEMPEVNNLYLQEISEYTKTNTLIETEKEQNAYIIYTSGTTGRPKGVPITQMQLMNSITYRNKVHNYGVENRNIAIYSQCFDAFLAAAFTPLIAGATLILPNDHEAKDPMMIKRYLKEKMVTNLDIVPSYLKVLLPILSKEHLPFLKYIVVGGEQCDLSLLKQCSIWRKDVLITNEYGPTETTILATLLKGITIEQANQIGSPADNTKIYILNGNLEAQPIGIPGDIWISGINVSSGYVNNQKLTEEKFREDPFNPGARMYYSGDRGIWCQNGSVKYLNRSDEQVKIHGYRIELREIEEHLMTYPDIKDCLVVELGETKNKYLCAYYTATSELDISRLRQHLGNYLPKYMLPSYYVYLVSLPMTSNGKRNKKSLPLPQLSERKYMKPRTETEILLADIFKKILQLEEIYREEDLFELGACSLHIAASVSQIYMIFQKEISLQFIFDFPTIAQIGEKLDLMKIVSENKKSNIGKYLPQDMYELTPEQKQIYIIENWQPGTMVYNMPVLVNMKKNVERGVLERIIQKIMMRNEALRLQFLEHEGVVIQKIRTNVEFHLDVIEDVTDFVKTGSMLIEPFILGTDLLIRAALLKSANQQFLFIDTHHLIFDGRTMEIFLSELLAYCEGQILPDKKLQYSDYVLWQSENDDTKGETYWLEEFSDMPEALKMPYDKTRPKELSYRGYWAETELLDQMKKKIYWKSAKMGVTPQILLLAVYSILISKYTGQTDIVIGIPGIGRTNEQLMQVMGMFAKTLPVRIKPNDNLALKAFFQKLRHTLGKVMENQEYPMKALISKLKLERHTNKNPLFDTMFIYQSKMDWDVEELPHPISKFDFSMSIYEKEEQLKLRLEYSTDIFQETTMNKLLERYKFLLEQVLNAEPDTPLSNLSILTTQDLAELNHWNMTKCVYPETTLVAMFKEQVRKTPNLLAVTDNSGSLTYKELDIKSNQLAHYLIGQGLFVEELVAIKLEKSRLIAIAIMGILKAGGAFVPLDLHAPEKRLKYIEKDSNIRFFIEDDILKLSEKEPPCDPFVQINNTNLAYVIYTSGTTGQPKGVLVEHRNIVNTVFFEIAEHKMSELDCTLILFSPAFDAFVINFFGALLSGGKMIIPSTEEGKDLGSICFYLKEYQVNYLLTVPSLFAAIIGGMNQEDLAHLQWVKLGGEKSSDAIIRQCKKLNPQLELVNGYGPTECAVEAVQQRGMTTRNNASIGRPIANTKVYILNEKKQLLPSGIVGEIGITGAGLARGYLNQPDLTKEKFVDVDFEKKDRMYLTGDKGRWNPDGTLEFFGRIDEQIKIRGYRVELLEIEHQLDSLPEIKQATVLFMENNNLYAFVTASVSILEDNIKERLSEYLPEYMIPIQIIQVQQMPYTLNGKIDKSKLSVLIRRADKKREQQPKTKEETILLGIWQELFGVTQIGLDESFFHLGGDSLMSIQIAAKLTKIGYEIRTKDIIRYPTIRKLAKQISPQVHHLDTALVVGEVLLTPIQRWFFDLQPDKKLPHFNQSIILCAKERIKLSILKKAAAQLVICHDALRMKFYQDECGNWKQYNQKYSEGYTVQGWEIPSSCKESDYIREQAAKCQEKVDIQKDILFRIDVFVGKVRDSLVLSFCHLITDAVSIRILWEDLEEFYKCIRDEMPIRISKTTSYMEWSKYLYTYAKEEVLIEEKRYWQRLLKSVQQKPYQKSVEHVGRNRFKINFSKDITAYLTGGAQIFYDTQINELLLVSLSRAYQQWQNEKELIVQLEGHGREELNGRLNITRTVGWFTSRFPINLEYLEDMNKHILYIRDEIRKIPNKGIGYGILKYLSEAKIASTIPDFVGEIGFNYLGEMDRRGVMGLFEISPISCENVVSFDLNIFHPIDFNGWIVNEELQFIIDYDNHCFLSAEIERFINYFKNTLIDVVNHCKNMLSNTPTQFEAASIHPFSEIFYKDCFYHGLFSALDGFGISRKPFLLNHISSCGYNLEHHSLEAANLEIKKEEELLNMYGLQAEKVDFSSHFVAMVKAVLLNNKLILLPVDCYQLSYRKDSYHSRHWSHVVLIYGYNEMNQTFWVVDHDEIQSQQFQCLPAAYQDMESGYCGYKECFAANSPYAYAISKKEDYHAGREFELAESLHHNFLKEQKEVLQNNLAAIIQYQNELEKLFQYEKRESERWQDCLFHLNEIIKGKMAEQYKVHSCMEDEQLIGAMDQVTTSWMMLRTKMQRYIILGKGTSADISTLITNIRKEERIYLKRLMLLNHIAGGVRE
jgi:amino acid adenylation domain-containing protein/non-ribosomal peptide synthase protein (TIGR01720 family)